jgi:hypothetical protein
MVTDRSHFSALRLVWLCVLLQTTGVRAQNATPAWAVGEPIFTYCTFAIPDTVRAKLSASYGWPTSFDPTTLTPAIAEQAVAGGFNLVWINDLSQLAIAEHYGLRAQYIVSGHQPQNNLFYPNSTLWPAPADAPAIDALIDRFKKSPAAYSYFIIDEPAASRFPHLAEIISYLKKRDPAHLAYVNLFPPDEVASDLGSGNYPDYLAEYIRTVKPALLSYDSYSLFAGNDRSLFLGNLQLFARAAAQSGIPFMTVVQGAQIGPKWRLPTTGELRFLTNAPLAFGAQGISYFNYWSPLGPASGAIAPNPDGTPTSVFTALRNLGPQFKAVAGRLSRLQWIGTYLKGYSAWSTPRYMTPRPVDAAFDVAAVTNSMSYADGAPLKGVLLGYFGSGCAQPACATQVFVQNLDYTSSKTYRVSGPRPLSVFDANAGTWTSAGHNYADVTLEAGGGALIGTTDD